ncbi:MAG: nitroreductase family deazaflavin-dependent oxidoreductase [Gordonia sp. (in: high G+C Gram-positive bacteria)]
MSENTTTRYLEPARIVPVMNRAVAWLAGRGMAPAGCHVLAVRGRTSGQMRTTPVNVLDHHGVRYLVAPRGDTQWVRNLRAAGEAELRRGRGTETVAAVEIGDQLKPELLGEYLRRWSSQVKGIVEGLTPESSPEEFAAAAPGFPVFELRRPKLLA